MTKSDQRKAIKSVVRTLSQEKRDTESLEAAKKLVASKCFTSAKTILAYMAMPYECDPKHAVDVAIKAGKTVAFPLCCEGNTLKLCVPNDSYAFVVGAYGIIEPDIARSTVIAPDDVDIIIVPALAYDRDKNRLGRGAGYYDRLLCDAKHAHKMGFVFDEQMIDTVCTESHDKKVDCVITASHIY